MVRKLQFYAGTNRHSAEISQFMSDPDDWFWGSQNTREKPRWKWSKCKLYLIEMGNHTNHSTFDGKPTLWNFIWFLEDRIHHPSIANNPAGLLGLTSRMGGTEDQNWAEMVQNHGQLLCITNTSSSGAGVSHFLPFKSLPYIYTYTCYYCSIV